MLGFRVVGYGVCCLGVWSLLGIEGFSLGFAGGLGLGLSACEIEAGSFRACHQCLGFRRLRSGSDSTDLS